MDAAALRVNSAPLKGWIHGRTFDGLIREIMADEEITPFDFVAHERAAVSDYLKVQPFYAELAERNCSDPSRLS